MKKIKLIAASLLASTLVMSGCGNDHQHTFKEEWSHDDETHWHEATCEHTDVKGSEEAHKDDDHNHKCDVCEFVMSECKDENGDHKCDICGADLPYVSSVSISGAPETLARGESVTLKVNVQAFSGASRDVTWSVDKAELASIDENGVFTAKANGAVVVTATSVADSSKKGSASITIVDPDWSKDVKDMMEENLGMVLPYFPGDFEWSKDGSSLIAESATATDTAKVIETYDALEIEKEVGEDYVEYTFPTDNEDLVVAVDVYEDEGKAYVEAYLAYKMLTEWPEEKVAAALDGYTTFEPESVPAAEGTQFGFELDTEYENSCYVLVIGSYSSYVTKLQDLGWTVYGVDQQNMIIRMVSPLSSIVIDIQVRSNEVFVANIYAVGDPVQPAAEWPTDEIAAMLEGYTEVEIPAAEGSGFVVEELDPEEDFYYGYIQVMDGNYEDYFATLEGAGFSTPAFDAKYGCYTTFKDDLAIDIFLSGSNFYIQPYHYSAPVAEWPAEQVAAFIGEHTEETVPAAEGTAFSTSEKTSPYSALVIDVTGDVSAYLSVLEGAEWQINDLTASNGYYDCYSPEHYLELAIFPDEGEFEIQLLLSEPPAPEFPAEALAEFIGDYTTDTVPAVEGTGFESGTAYEGSMWYCDIAGGVANDYLATLSTAGYTIHSAYGDGYYVATSPSGALDIAIIEGEGMIEIQVTKVVAPELDEYPADLVNAFTGAVTEEVLVAPEADGFDVVGEQEDFYGDTYYELVARYGDANSYAYTLYMSGWVVDASNYEDYGLFLAQSPGKTLTLQIWDNGTEFLVDIYASEPAPAEFPADNIAAFIGDHSDTVVPAAEGTAFNDVGYNDYYGSYEVIVTGDMDAYQTLLLSSGFTYNGESYWGYLYLSADEKVQIEVSENGASAFYIDVYLVEPLVPADFPTEAINAFLAGKTDETVPGCFATKFEVHDYETYLSIEADNASVADYMATLKAAGWDADYDSYAYYNYATSPEESIKITLVDHSSYGYVEINIEYLEPKLTEWPTDAVAEALGDNAKTTLPGISGEGVKFDFEDLGSDTCSILVYGATPADYVKTLTDAGFEVTQGSAEDYYWYLLSADKTVKVYVGDDLADGKAYFTIRAYGQVPTWTSDTFDASVVEQALGLDSGFIPAIADGTKFAFAQTSETSMKVTVESGANYDNFIAALGAAGFEETSAGSNTFTKDNVVATVKIENPITQKYSVEYTVQSSPTPQGEWPLDQIKALLGDERGELLPEAVGATSVIVTGSDGDCNISITGVSAEVYKQALLDAGFSFDGMSYSKGDLYVNVTGSGDSCTVNAYYFNF